MFYIAPNVRRTNSCHMHIFTRRLRCWVSSASSQNAFRAVSVMIFDDGEKMVLCCITISAASVQWRPLQRGANLSMIGSEGDPETSRNCSGAGSTLEPSNLESNRPRKRDSVSPVIEIGNSSTPSKKLLTSSL